MVSFTDFIAALKATRIRRILHSNANWTELLSSELNIIIYNLWIFGIDYINNLTVNNQKVLDRCFKVVQRKKKYEIGSDFYCDGIFQKISVGGISVFSYF